ncbi:hypothetical protein GEMRC1_000720 [Eukaryota sp. GEM-RC1]
MLAFDNDSLIINYDDESYFQRINARSKSKRGCCCFLFFLLLIALCLTFATIVFRSFICHDPSQRKVEFFSYPPEQVHGIVLDLQRASVRVHHHSLTDVVYINVTHFNNLPSVSNVDAFLETKRVWPSIPPFPVLSIIHEAGFLRSIVNCEQTEVDIFIPELHKLHLLDISIASPRSLTSVSLPAVTIARLEVYSRNGYVTSPALTASYVRVNAGMVLDSLRLLPLSGLSKLVLEGRSVGESQIISSLLGGSLDMSSATGAVNVTVDENWTGIADLSTTFGRILVTNVTNRIEYMTNQNRHVIAKVGDNGHGSINMNSIQGEILFKG